MENLMLFNKFYQSPSTNLYTEYQLRYINLLNHKQSAITIHINGITSYIVLLDFKYLSITRTPQNLILLITLFDIQIFIIYLDMPIANLYFQDIILSQITFLFNL